MSSYAGPPSPHFGYDDDDSGGGGYLSYAKGVKLRTPSKNKVVTGRILPAHSYQAGQFRAPDDDAFRLSVAPYRIEDQIDEDTNHPKFTAWFMRVPIYGWFGRKKESFLSPRARRYMIGDYQQPDMWDPIHDIREVARQHSNPMWKGLTEKPANSKEKAVIPYAEWRCFYNFWGCELTKPQEWDNMIIDLSSKGGEDLRDKINEWRPAHEQPITPDPRWQGYLFGDFTDPRYGLRVTSSQIPNSPQDFNGLVFKPGAHNTAAGVEIVPVGADVLRKRAVLGYEDVNGGPWIVYSYQFLVDYIVADGLIPYELVMEACSGRANMPKAPTSYGSAVTMPGAPRPPAGPAQPQGRFWVLNMATNTVETNLSDAASITGRVMAGEQLQLAPEDSSRPWGSAESFGFRAQQTPPPQQGYAPPPQQGYAPPPQQGYAPPPQQGYAPPPQAPYTPPPQQPYTPPQQPAQQPYTPPQQPGSAPSPQEPWTPSGQQYPTQGPPATTAPHSNAPDPAQTTAPSQGQHAAQPGQENSSGPQQAPNAVTDAIRQAQSQEPVTDADRARYVELESRGITTLSPAEVQEWFHLGVKLGNAGVS